MDALVSVVLALLALIVGSFTRAGVVLGLIAVVGGVAGVLRAEKTEVGMPTALFGIVIGLVAVLWTAVSFASR